MNINPYPYTQQILRENGIDLTKIPDSIYKYRTIDEYTDKLFTEGHLWFSKPVDFNDLFDCQFHVHSDNTGDDIKRFLMKVAPSMPLHERNRIANKTTADPNSWNKLLNKCFNTELNKSGICCFAGSSDNKLMWAHYGNGHRGFCLKFDWKDDLDFFMIPLPATYTSEYPHIDYLKEPKLFLTKMISTKSEEWEYEQEIRIFKHDKQGLIKFKKSVLKEVIFGAKCDEDSIEHLKQVINTNGYSNVKFKKVTARNSAFKLEIIDLP